MAQWLKQSTAVTVKIGPFVDSSDGNTEEGGLTLSQADIRLCKNAGNIAQKNEATTCTYDEVGMYDCPLDTTDTNTLGRLELIVHEAGALPVRHEYMVVPANVWDSMFGADKLQVDVEEIGTGIITAAAVHADAATEIADAVGALTVAELAATPDAEPTLLEALALLFMLVRNKHETDSALSEERIYNDAGTCITKGTIADTGSVASKAKLVNGP